MAAQHAIRRDHSRHLVSVLAAPSHVKLPNSKQQGALVQNSTQWGRVFLTMQWWSENEFVQLKVDLIYHFARNTTGELTPVSKGGQPISKPLVTGSTIIIQSSHIPATDQLLQREVAHTARLGRAEHETLLAKWSCGSYACPNRGFYCYVDKLDGKHLNLDTITAKLLNTLINTDPSDRLPDNEPLDYTLQGI